MDGKKEFKAFLQVYLTILGILSFCFLVVRKFPKGVPRLVFILPIISIFTYLPLQLNSVHLQGMIAGVITWVCSSKLILFAFDQGPLSCYPATNFLPFIYLACLPVQLKDHNPNSCKKGPKSTFNYTVKILLLASLFKIYKYRDFIHPNLLLILYGWHLYFILELILAITAIPARALLRYEIAAQFDEPYLCTSLQDFWGRRWNLMITGILRPSVYLPVRNFFTPILGRKWALGLGQVSTFAVSGLMHELIYWYLSHEKPTWEVTWFFVLHGVCTTLEILAKSYLRDRWQLHSIVSRVLTIGFVVVTASWLFFAQPLRYKFDLRMKLESHQLANYIKGAIYAH
ncbi:hypothetical protein ACHQM5_009537 [Ranunculus cassubicifolius]